MATGGDCYEAALEFMVDNHEQTDEFTLIHGIATGQGPIKGMLYGHAWVEQGDVVFDYSNGKQVVMRKEDYYALGSISKTVRYTFDEMADLAVKTGHSGPWEPGMSPLAGSWTGRGSLD